MVRRISLIVCAVRFTREELSTGQFSVAAAVRAGIPILEFAGSCGVPAAVLRVPGGNRHKLTGCNGTDQYTRLFCSRVTKEMCRESTFAKGRAGVVCLATGVLCVRVFPFMPASDM